MHLLKIQISKAVNCDREVSPPTHFFFLCVCEILLPKRKWALLQSYFWLPPLSAMSTHYRKWAIIFLSSTSSCFLCMLYCLHWGHLCLQRPRHRWKWRLIRPSSNQALNLDWSERTNIHREIEPKLGSDFVLGRAITLAQLRQIFSSHFGPRHICCHAKERFKV